MLRPQGYVKPVQTPWRRNRKGPEPKVSHNNSTLASNGSFGRKVRASDSVRRPYGARTVASARSSVCAFSVRRRVHFRRAERHDRFGGGQKPPRKVTGVARRRGSSRGRRRHARGPRETVRTRLAASAVDSRVRSTCARFESLLPKKAIPASRQRKLLGSERGNRFLSDASLAAGLVSGDWP
jgi:hypothetical protein